MHTVLPPELCDMVYAQLWDDKVLQDTQHRMTAPICLCGDSDGSQKCRESVATSEPGTKSCCSYHFKAPFFVNPIFVGQEAALEIVEAWYASSLRMQDGVWEVNSLQDLNRVTRCDAFCLELDPATVLRKLSIDVHIERLFEKKCSCIPSQQQRCIDSLLRIQRKKDFELTINLKQRQLRFNLWPRALDIFRKAIETFEQEGARVKMKLEYHKRLYYTIDYDMLPALRDFSSNWRQDAASHFDTVGHPKTSHIMAFTNALLRHNSTAK